MKGLSFFWIEDPLPPGSGSAGIVRLIRRAAAWLDARQVVWLGLLAPVYLFPSARLSPLLLGVPLLWGVSLAAGRAPLPRTRFSGWLLLLGVMLLVSLYATYSIQVSLPKLAGVVYGIAVFAWLARWLRGRPPVYLRAACLLLGAAGLGVALLGLLGIQWFTTKFTVLNSLTGLLPKVLRGLPGAPDGFQPNQVAGTLLWLLPLLAMLAWERLGGGTRGVKTSLPAALVLALGLVFCLAVFVLTQSRSAYIGLALAGVWMGWALLPGGWRRWTALAGLALLLVGGAWLALGGGDPSAWLEALIGGGDTLLGVQALSLNSLAARVEIWSRGWMALQDFPLTGLGMNTWRYAVHALYPLPGMQATGMIGHAHNELLQAGLDLGLPGMLAYAGLQVAAARILWVAWLGAGERGADTNRRSIRLIALGLAGGLLAHALYGLTDAVALGSKPGVIFWAILGIISALEEKT